ncbi:MAG: ATP-binding cassette domain-containing protein [Deltaproteobacteria bacterium]|jgi:NitT/TauT family transport system ATP-binding protein|nr:ATP-binding cassette domain-containing protein [Deltaproteobacteria bacterium]
MKTLSISTMTELTCKGFLGVEVKSLSASHNNTDVIFKDISFTLPKGHSVALVGSSGCGKTTLLNLIYGLFPGILVEGTVTISPKSTKKAYVMQDIGLFPWKTVKENLMLPLILEKVPKEKRIIAPLLEELGIGELSQRYPFELSGGERQRVALARALVTGGELILMDEPFSALDAITREKLQDSVALLFNRRGITFILATHSMEEAAILGDIILVLGGKPTRILGQFSNPDRRLKGARNSDQFFKIVTDTRKCLASGSSL